MLHVETKASCEAVFTLEPAHQRMAHEHLSTYGHDQPKSGKDQRFKSYFFVCEL